ncbi:hypothetical protein ACVLV4_000438 [Rathayibacter agropyri]
MTNDIDAEKSAIARADFLRESAVLQEHLDAFPDLTVALAVYMTGMSVADALRIGA